MSPRWTAKTPLPGGDFDWAKFEDEVDEARAHWKFLGEQQARRMVAAYGSRLVSILGEAKDKSDLGPAFGPDLTGAEVRYLMTREWARFPDDILWRRSKLGLTMPAADREALAAFMAHDVRQADTPNLCRSGAISHGSRAVEGLCARFSRCQWRHVPAHCTLGQ